MRIEITIEKKHFIITGVITALLIAFFAFSHLFIPPKVAILYIATGRYITFWDKFYTSMEQNFLPNIKKQYFVFTDDKQIDFPKNVTKIDRSAFGFPEDSMERFKMFLEAKNELKKYDYIYFLNANAMAVAPIDETILPSKEQGLVVAEHPAYYNKTNVDNFPYERNPDSLAYIPTGKGKIYVQASFFGGRTDDFLEMTKKLAHNIQRDSGNDILATWQDESHLNKYIIDKNPLVLPPTYVWAPFDVALFGKYKDELKIIMRTKNTPFYGTTSYLRGTTDKKLTPELEKIAPLVANMSEVEIQMTFPVQTDNWLDYLNHVDQTVFCRMSKPKECGSVVKGKNSLTIHWQYGEKMPLHYDFGKGVYVPFKQ